VPTTFVTLRWAFIGTGRVSRQMAAAVSAAPTGELHSVVSRDPSTGERFAQEHGAFRSHASVGEMVADPDVDIVYVASPNGLHREHVVAAADAGKHVLCEKPMANDRQACLEMIAACRRSGVELGIGFQYRHHPAHRAVRSMVLAGELGTPVLADAAVHVPPMPTPDWYSDQSLAGGGVLPMSGVHRLDLLRFVLGSEVSDVSAFVASRDAGRLYEDTVAAVLRFESGVLATVRFALGAVSAGDGVGVHGTRGWATTTRTTSQWWGGDGGALNASADGTVSDTPFPSTDLYLAQVESFADAVSGTSSFPAGGVDGLRAVEVTAALIESAKTGVGVRVERADVEGGQA
jgi:1,5-anhydro-D-fructose reductase (1,5-anhydro-D-mannitol-forming)